MSDLRAENIPAGFITLGDETRRAIVPYADSRHTFAVEVPEDPRLQLAIGVATGSRVNSGFPVNFTVLVDGNDGDRVAHAATVRRADRNRWIPAEVDLTPWAGKQVQLSLVVEQPTPSDDGDALYPLWASPVVSDRRDARTRPPVVLISVDCLRADHLGAYGYDEDISPAIDAFAAESTLFENAVAVSSWTLPTHMSMFTGLNPSYHGVDRTRSLSPSTFYLPEVLASAGYETTAVVSGAYVSQAFGFARGFHRYLSLKQPEASETIDEALSALDRSHHRDTFMFLHLIDAHWPYEPPEDLLAKLGPTPVNLPHLLDKVVTGAAPVGTDVADLTRLYDGEIADIDRELGRFFAELKERGIYDDALIILTSDHGEAFYEHGHWAHITTLYEEMIRIPLIVKWPGREPAARVSRYASQVDIVPTVLEAVDLFDALPRTSQGTTLSDRMESGDTDAARAIISEVIWASSTFTSKKVAFRAGRYKYVASYTGAPPDAASVDEMQLQEVYDLVDDPDERHNLVDSEYMDDFEARLHRYLEASRGFRESQQGQQSFAIDEELEERLRALGYLR